jgi:hypothetical protein
MTRADNSNTKIMKCVCKNKFQDKRYGMNRRVHNKQGGKGGRSINVSWSCTVCNSEIR